MKKLLLALALVVSPVSADNSSPPPDMFHQTVPFSLYCVNSFERMVEIMHDDFREVPILMSHMSEISTIVVFINKDKTTSTYVGAKVDKQGKEEVCILWSGKSEEGLSFSLNPNPVFPEPLKNEGTEL